MTTPPWNRSGALSKPSGFTQKTSKPTERPAWPSLTTSKPSITQNGSTALWVINPLWNSNGLTCMNNHQKSVSNKSGQAQVVGFPFNSGYLRLFCRGGARSECQPRSEATGNNG